jgi:DNA mismatch endonuclease (patch repair protein)
MANNTFLKAGYTTTSKRSRIMARIRSHNTKPELIIRKLLFLNGYGYRLHYKKLPGSPDLALTKYKVAIFVNGCFWHYHGCPISHLPKANSPYWVNKIKRNLLRDKENCRSILALGWRILIIWECAVSGKLRLSEEQLVSKILLFINGKNEAEAISGFQ